MRTPIARAGAGCSSSPAPAVVLRGPFRWARSPRSASSARVRSRCSPLSSWLVRRLRCSSRSNGPASRQRERAEEENALREIARRRHEAAELGRGHPRGPSRPCRGRRGQPCQDRLPRLHEPRDPHAVELASIGFTGLDARQQAELARQALRSTRPSAVQFRRSDALLTVINDILDFSARSKPARSKLERCPLLAARALVRRMRFRSCAACRHDKEPVDITSNIRSDRLPDGPASAMQSRIQQDAC